MAGREDWAWAAGFYDGEGCTRLQSHTPVVTISQKNKEVLEKFQNITGVGAIYKMSTRELYQYNVSSFAESQYVIASMWSWLGSIKQRQATKVLTEAKSFKRKWQVCQDNGHDINRTSNKCRTCSNNRRKTTRSMSRYGR